jgi:clathrin heavy chain
MISCEQIFRTRLSQEPIFVVTKNNVNDGILAITKSGSLIGGVVDESTLLPTIMNAKNIPNAKQLAFQIAGRYKLPGVENMFIEQFNTLLTITRSTYPQPRNYSKIQEFTTDA